ncbi:DUF4390 domain-containing protein [Acidovorax sp. SUPP2539]|uniref:DUF4390 domain-containing protein n=1 Tax=Acidovorax sp. SUPP2539 TaxID=2920878 RepID=UPI0023DE3ECE|nr:DUF4390 domain-containing protein [Acidovorax sp. SUPP2539]GKS92420.1 DUF4390 domain-containing protein [Acidovorax sp. SUPP2539]
MRLEQPASRPAAWLSVAVAALLCICLALWSPAVLAQPDAGDLRVEGNDEGLYLSTTLHFDLPELAEDALYKGISMYFVAEADVVRERWYWYDKAVAHSVRYLRLSYQPLTRRWRLNQSATPFANTGLGVALGQNFDELGDALSAMQRISRWKIADADEVSGGPYTVHFQFRLDMSQLPRPFQIGAVGRSGWDLMLSRSVRAVAERAP